MPDPNHPVRPATGPPVRINIDDVDFDDGVNYLHDGLPMTGEVVETDHDGNVIELTPVVNGRANGVELSWYSDGTLHIETTVVDGRATGTSRRWHRNGQLAEERDFDPRGALVAIRLWDEDGTPVPREPGRATRPDR
jgi:antitoxin component YwqK of YwqJK toxin-antitoxin module